MKRACVLLLLLCALALAAGAQTVRLGEPMAVEMLAGPDLQQSLPMEVRPLYVGNRLQEYTTGEAHEIGPEALVVQRAFRVSDRVFEEGDRLPPRWRWQRDGWLLVERNTGRVTLLELPDYDPFYSTPTWQGDQVAYCGVSQDGESLFAVVAQVGREKPLLRRELGRLRGMPTPDSECLPPKWHADPLRVTFSPEGRREVTFDVEKGTRVLNPEEPQ